MTDIMSFATPGMTHDMGFSNVETKQPYFSNAGQIDFRPGVKIGHSPADESVPTANEVPTQNGSSEAGSIQYAINGGKITATLTPSDSVKTVEVNTGVHDEVQSLTVAENSKRLARMICNKQAESNLDPYDNMRTGSFRSMNKYANDDYAPRKYASKLTTQQNTNEKFDSLVKEFISKGKPDFDSWLGLNESRENLSIKTAKNLYQQIKMQANIEGSKKSIKSNSTSSNPSNNLEQRVSALETEQKLLVEGGHQNRMAIKSKVKEMEKGLEMMHSKLEDHGSKINIHDSMLKSMPTKTPFRSKQNGRESFAETVSVPVAMNLKAMSEAIAMA